MHERAAAKGGTKGSPKCAAQAPIRLDLTPIERTGLHVHSLWEIAYSSAGYAGLAEWLGPDPSRIGGSLAPIMVETASKVPVIVG